jgi:hypothetical protein
VDEAIKSLEERIAHIEDVEQVRALCIAYSRYADERDFESQSGLFAEEGVFVAPTGSFTGPAEILAFLNSSTPSAAPSSHVVTNLIVDVNADRADARVTWTYLVAGEDGLPTPRSHGYYFHTFVRDRGNWKILRRESTRRMPPE